MNTNALREVTERETAQNEMEAQEERVSGVKREKRDKELFDTIAERYSKKDVVRSTKIARRYRAECALKPLLENGQNLGTVVDLGCGVGATSQFFRDKFTKYIGIDNSPEMIEAGKKIFQSDSNIEFHVDNARDLSLPENTADVTFVIGSLHHMTDLDQVMRSIIRITKPGGTFIAIEPQSTNPLISLMREIRFRLDGDYSEEQQFFKPEALRALCENEHMTDIELDYQGYFSTPFAQVIMPFQPVSAALSELSVGIDKFLSTVLPESLKKLSWDAIVRAKIKK